MTARPLQCDGDYAELLAANKENFVNDDGTIAQHGAALVATSSGPPRWPSLESAEPIIEMFVVSPSGELTATSDNEPFVSAWRPLGEWMVDAVHDTLATHGLRVEGDGYLTASLTAADELEGMSHMDDDGFVPQDNVGAVAIIGQLAGPRVASGSLAPEPLRPMGQVQFSEAVHAGFDAGRVPQVAANGDELVIFPQFGQLHAGPSAEQLRALDPAPRARQLLVYRVRVTR